MRIQRIALLFTAAMSIAGGALAQSYPAKPVRMVITLSSGSATDVVGRAVGQKLSEIWGQPVVVENRPGAGGTIGAAAAARSPADGYTLLVAGLSHAASASLYAGLPYDTLRDFVEVAPLVTMHQALFVAPSVGVKSVSELIAAAKARPGQLTFASAGTGTSTYFAGEKFRLAAAIDVVHVPYKGGPEAMNDVMMGRVTYWIGSVSTALPLIQTGKLLALGVGGRQRCALLPEVPTISEAGVTGFEAGIWLGVWAPAGTPADIVDKIAADIARALAKRDLQGRLEKVAAEPLQMTPAEFGRFVRSEVATVKHLVQATGMRVQ